MSRKKGLAVPSFKKAMPKNAEQSNVPQDSHFLPIGDKIEKMIAYGVSVIEKMPRGQKPILGKVIEGHMWDLLYHTTKAGRIEDKAYNLQEAVVYVDMLRSSIRSGFIRGVISPTAYKSWVVHNDSIGIDVGNWHRSLKPKNK